jgi:choline dehydrogenase-like flavoprotein
MLDYDWDVFLAAARFVRKFFATAPMSSIVDSEAIPGTATIPSDGSDDEWKAHFEENFRPGWHGVGSCAMLPREWGGVVDGDLKVYGTQNVRVADASVIPFVLGGHPTSTIYAVAERLSELILKGEKG